VAEAPAQPAAQPLQLGEARVFVGTCSWADATLVKETSWYPKRAMSAAERLSYYASKFSLVEADSTYYRPLSRELALSWAQRVPEGFSFNIKAYGLFTGHPIDPATLWPDIRSELDEEAKDKRRVYSHHLPPDAVEEAWARFASSLSPLSESGHLGAVLFQYPPWFVPRRSNRQELARLAERLGGLTACVEFRSPKWLSEDERERTLGLLRACGLALVVVDAPKASGLPVVLEVTRDDLAVVRFHGRSDSTWDAKGVSAAERFRYLYNEEELAEWAPKAAALARRASRVHLLMNNCYRDYGVANAAQLARLLAAMAA
jgi:uncharacterized protein YecE (DUF72 family)